MILIEIIPNLYIGDIESLKYKSNLNISAIINCAKDLKSLDSYSNYVYDIKKNIERILKFFAPLIIFYLRNLTLHLWHKLNKQPV